MYNIHPILTKIRITISIEGREKWLQDFTFKRIGQSATTERKSKRNKAANLHTVETATELERRVSLVLWSFSMRTTFSFRRVSTRKRAYRGWCSTGQNILLFNPRFFRALFSKYGNSLNTRSIGESEKERAKREGKREREGVFQSTAMDSTSITCLRCTADRCSTLFAVAWLLIPPFNDAETRVCKPCLVKWMDWYFLPSPSVRCLVRRRGFVVLSYA